MGGITNPLTVIEQITFLLYARLLDINEARDENREKRTGKSFTRRFKEDEQHLALVAVPPPWRREDVTRGAGRSVSAFPVAGRRKRNCLRRIHEGRTVDDSEAFPSGEGGQHDP